MLVRISLKLAPGNEGETSAFTEEGSISASISHVMGNGVERPIAFPLRILNPVEKTMHRFRKRH